MVIKVKNRLYVVYKYRLVLIATIRKDGKLDFVKGVLPRHAERVAKYVTMKGL